MKYKDAHIRIPTELYEQYEKQQSKSAIKQSFNTFVNLAIEQKLSTDKHK